MNEEHDNRFQTNNSEIDLRELFGVLWKGKSYFISFTAFASIIGLVYSLYLPNIYESNALLTPTDSSSSISRSLQDYAGLAGLAGISLDGGADESNSAKAMKKLNSLSFFENNVLPNIFLPDLMALKSWDYETEKLYYNESIFNERTNSWVRDYSYPFQQKPSAQESFEVFKTHFNSTQDSKTGFITLSVKHQSPFIAKEWAELLIEEVNAFYRQKDKSESEKAVSYLKKQIASTNLSDVKNVISKLLQDETQKLSLIEANKYYVFEFIDPPVAMEINAEPRRSVIFVLFAIMGSLLGVFFILIKHYLFDKKT